jgi:ribosomal-protein-serine acetyltransferase
MNKAPFSLIVSDDVTIALRTEDEAEATFILIENNRAYLQEWLPWVPHVQSINDCLHFIRQNILDQEDGTDLTAGIYYKGRLVGIIGFHGLLEPNKNCSIGYWLDAGCQGHGIVTICAAALTRYAFDVHKMNRVEIMAGVNNSKSRAIPERIGFKFEGVMRGAQYLYGKYIDVAMYARLKDDL